MEDFGCDPVEVARAFATLAVRAFLNREPQWLKPPKECGNGLPEIEMDASVRLFPGGTLEYMRVYCKFTSPRTCAVTVFRSDRTEVKHHVRKFSFRPEDGYCRFEEEGVSAPLLGTFPLGVPAPFAFV